MRFGLESIPLDAGRVHHVWTAHILTGGLESFLQL